MALTVSGDFRALRSLATKIRRLADDATRQRLSKALAEEALDQVALGFSAGRDPYGAAWKPSWRSQAQGGQPLSDTARLRRSWSRQNMQARPDGFTIGTNVKYAAVHQTGKTIRARPGGVLRFKNATSGKMMYAKRVVIPKRQMVPENQLGPIWSAALMRAGNAWFATNTP
jgi:phage gpG-like protein